MISLSLSEQNCEDCDWSFNITISSPDPSNDDGDQCYIDNIIGGMCTECSDGFYYGEDNYDIGGSGVDCYTDGYFVNADWVGTEDNHDPPIECTGYKFTTDIRAIHSPSDLLVWNVNAGQVNTDQNLLKFEWEIDNIPIGDNNFSDYDIYMYIGDSKINMKEDAFTYISTSDLGYVPDGTFNDNGAPNYTTNIKVFMGGCAEDGLTTYYPDNDGDGLGTNSGEFSQYCSGFEPSGFATNNLDMNDTIFCYSNNIDSCGVCDGEDADLDCMGECFGDAIIDDCGICSGGSSGHIYNIDIDCNGDCFGTAFFDDCGICSGGDSAHNQNSDMDCSGECFGSSLIDSCGICNGQNLSCLDSVFGNGPTNLYAMINDTNVLITWDFENIDSYPDIDKFQISHYNNEEFETIGYTQRDENYEVYSYEYLSGTFCIAAIDIYGNVDDLLCSEATVEETFTFTINNSANMISFPAIPNNTSIDHIFNSLTSLGDGSAYTLTLISEGLASSYSFSLGRWVGTIEDINQYSGYYLSIDLGYIYGNPESTLDLTITGTPVSCNDISYTLKETNFISFHGNLNTDIDNAFQASSLEYITHIIGQGLASAYIPDIGWVGALTMLERGKGYWIRTSLVADQEINFQWNCDY